MATITTVNNGDTGLVARTAWNTNDTNLNTDLNTVTGAVTTLATDIYSRFYKGTANIVANTDLVLPNPLTSGIPNTIVCRDSSGVELPMIYNSVNQATGAITLNSGKTYNNLIIIVIGW